LGVDGKARDQLGDLNAPYRKKEERRKTTFWAFLGMTRKVRKHHELRAQNIYYRLKKQKVHLENFLQQN
jgi:hypothetical protein